MTRSEAKKVLEVFRPMDRDSQDAAMREALALTRTDAELRAWFEQHQRTEQAIREKFRTIAVPETLKQRLLQQEKIVRPSFGWSAPQWMKLAASFVVLLGVLALTYYAVDLRQARFAEFQSRMVRSALREYKMELITRDMTQLRQWMGSRRAPADFAVPQGLAKLTLTGGGVLRWHDHPVSMACFDRGDKQMIFLFVMDRTALTDPPAAPQLEQVKKLATVSWSEGQNTYLLAGPGNAESLQKYLAGS